MPEPVHRLWAMGVAPPTALSDGGVVVRPPDDGDIDALAGYAPDAADHGIWLPTGVLDLSPRTWAAWFVRELRLGWTSFGGRYGGGLVAGFVGEPIAAYLNFVPHEPPAAELCYGVAPDARGRGLATTAARLATEWALTAGLERVELFISVDHAESRRVAAKAGFTEVDRVTKHVRATGMTYEDIVFARS